MNIKIKLRCGLNIDTTIEDAFEDELKHVKTCNECKESILKPIVEYIQDIPIDELSERGLDNVFK